MPTFEEVRAAPAKALDWAEDTVADAVDAVPLSAEAMEQIDAGLDVAAAVGIPGVAFAGLVSSAFIWIKKRRAEGRLLMTAEALHEVVVGAEEHLRTLAAEQREAAKLHLAKPQSPRTQAIVKTIRKPGVPA